MKATVLHEPYASLMAAGMKTIETRGWRTSYRGDLVVCAAKKSPKYELILTGNEQNELIARGIRSYASGVALCVVEIYDCVLTVDLVGDVRLDTEANFGDYTPGRYGWLTRNPRRLSRPVPIKGFQRIFHIDDDSEVGCAIKAQL